MATTLKIVTIFAWLTIGVYGQLPYGYETPNAPSQYNYDWRVQDAYSANDFGQEEARTGYNIDGGYSVLLPDGRKQIVTYKVADAYSGYVADVRYEGEAKYEPYQPPQYGAVPFTVHNAAAYKSYGGHAVPAPKPHHTTFAAPVVTPYVPHAAPSYNSVHTAPAYPINHYRPSPPKAYIPTAPAYPVYKPAFHKYNFKPIVTKTAPAPPPAEATSTPAPAPPTTKTTLAPKKVTTEAAATPPVYIPSYKRPKIQYASNRLDSVLNGSLFYSDLGKIKAEVKSKKNKEHHSYY